jgi:hypothetical protein
MARMRTGRLTPRTTDPQGNRITDPDVYGKKIEEGTVGSWPEARKVYQKAKASGRPLNMDYHPDVKKYLEGETNQLSDTEFEEPIMTKTSDEYGLGKRDDFYTNFKKGGKNYNRMEARTKSNLGKFYEPYKEGQMGQYHSAQTEANINKFGSFAGHYTTDLDQYRKKSVKSEYIKPVEPIKLPTTPEEITFDKLPLRKPTKITTAKKAIIKAKDKPEPAAFVNPGKPIKMGESISMNPLAGGATSKGSGKRYAKQVIASIGKTGDNHIGYNREQRLFKAKSSTGASGQDFTDFSSKEIKGIRKDYLKKDLKAARSTPVSTPEDAGKRAKNIAAAKMEINQSRGAQRYSKKMEKGNLNHFTPGYNEGKNKNEDSRNDRGRIFEYKSSQDNVNNRNTIDAKLKAIGEKTKKYEAGKATSTRGGFQYNNFSQ